MVVGGHKGQTGLGWSTVFLTGVKLHILKVSRNIQPLCRQRPLVVFAMASCSKVADPAAPENLGLRAVSGKGTNNTAAANGQLADLSGGYHLAC